MELIDLKCFLAVAEELHFGRAARRLMTTTSNVSQTIRKLERELGVPLFERTSRRVALTPAGSALIGEARTILVMAERFHGLAQEVTAAREDEITLVYAAHLGPLALALLDIVKEKIPDLRLEVDIRPTAVAVIQALDGGEATFGIANAISPLLEHCVVSPERCMYVYMRSDHRLAGQSVVFPQDLHNESIIGAVSTNPMTHKSVTDYFVGRHARPIFRIRNVDTVWQLFELVLMDQGLAFSQFTCACPPGVVSRPLDSQTPQWVVNNVLWRPGAREDVVAAFEYAAATVFD